MKTFEELFVDKTKYGAKVQTSEYKENGAHIIIDQGQSQIAGYTDRENGLFEEVPAIIFGDHTRVIKYVDEPFFLGADGVKVLRSNDKKANYKYLYYALKNVNIPNTGYNRHFKWLKEIKIKYPNNDVQDEIVSILDKVSDLISKRKVELQALDELIKARFVELFGSIHESIEYPYVVVKNLTDVISGGTPNRECAEYWNDGTIPWVKTTELHNNLINETDEYITEAGLSNSSAKLVPAGTVLIAMYGQGKTRGMTAYLDIEASTNQACACILPSDKINSIFMWKYFQLSYDKLRGLAQGAGQPNLNGNMIKNFKVLVPPIELQNTYVDFVTQVDKSKAAVQKALNETQLLFDLLMQQYFG